MKNTKNFNNSNQLLSIMTTCMLNFGQRLHCTIHVLYIVHVVVFLPNSFKKLTLASPDRLIHTVQCCSQSYSMKHVL